MDMKPLKSGFGATIGVLVALVVALCFCSGVVVSCVAIMSSQPSP